MIRMVAAVRATVTVAALLAGVPIVLLAVGRNPLPDRVPSAAQLDAWLEDPLRPEYVPATARVFAWLIWAIFAAAVLTGMWARVRRWRWALLAIYLPGPVQGLAATVLGAATVTTVAGVLPVHAAAAAAASDSQGPGPGGAANTAGVSGPTAGGRPGSEHRAHVPERGLPTVTVRRGDTLWDIAAQRLGDPDRWRQIYRLNSSRYPHNLMRGGDHIEPGWTLTLPATAAPAHPSRPPQTGTPAPTTPASSTTTTSPRHGCTGGPAFATPRTSTPPGATAAPAATPGGQAGTPARAKGGVVAGDDSAPGAGRRHGPVAGVSLPGGSWVDLGLAAAVTAAAALVWVHRRRRYTRRAASADLRLNEPATAPMPPVVRQIRRQLRTASDAAGGTRTVEETPSVDGGPGGERLDGKRDNAARPAPLGFADGAGSTSGPRPAVPSLAHPLAAVWPPAGLGLTGPGAHAAARGFLTAALAAGGLDAPDARTRVIMPSATAAALLGTGGAAMPDTPRLSITTGLDEALDLLEAQTLRRSRIAYTHEVDTVAELRATAPAGEPLPPILLLAHTAGRHQRTRVAALLAQGQRLDIHGILLGAWPDGDTVVVAADGTTAPAGEQVARHGPHPADIGRLAILTPAETADLLQTLAESHTGRPPAEAGPAPAGAADSPPQPAHEGEPRTAPVEPSHDPAAQPVRAPNPLPTPGPAAPTATGPGRVDVTVLGAASIGGLPAGLAPRKKSLEVLVYLAVHDGDATAEEILDDVLPDAPTSKAPGRLYTYISDLRTIMRRTGGDGTYLTHPGQRYVLNRDSVDVDLWRMRDAIRAAQQASDPGERVTALRRATDAYGGHLADGADYEWAEPYREAIRLQALDAYLALADALAGRPAEQLTVLETAIRHNPYTEELYRQAMVARAALGHLAEIDALRQALARALAEIDAQPSPETVALADHLVARLRRPDPRPARRPADGAAA